MAVEPLLGTRAQRAFVLTIAVQAIVVIVMVGLTFNRVRQEVVFTNQYKTLPCYLSLFILAEIFELAMAFDALRLRNVIELLGIIFFHAALIVFSALQVHESRVALVTTNCPPGTAAWVCSGGPGSLWRKVEPFLIVAPCIIGASWLFLIFWIKQLYEEFGWVIFHVVGANPKLKSMYQYYQILICLLKFDFFCFVGVTMQLLIVVLSDNTAEFGITIAAIPVVLFLLSGCAFAVQREIKWLMGVSLALMLAAMTYLYKLVRFYEPSSQAEYSSTRATLTTFTIVAFLLLLASFCVGVRCFLDFDKGLHESKVNGQSYRPVKIHKDVFKLGGMSERQSSYFTGGAPLGPRISIE
ncbi:hypothetical protein SERLA73DRAFT_191102 [Serpula lacrymans var. lacrymans S7.3]|uniref:Uncharacterized protein n=2 Tax=Serpula lacrymans var. lacrymans TaxID=341189 RepID=F8QGX2_SERL3|nr:uncharacterized protein SERLADRAFT_480699 [Serpula lacrymans var. lacrymans S7.9]EGN92454.1 hypothetical protein SERLA73DRAFT_191102 [Serpula lacrymans var. lacrymans S7.3]EGO18581.1 hypothetical protein SERLADRAFT_480699 [Serpula lacrymans var. lacrymans S7.9]